MPELNPPLDPALAAVLADLEFSISQAQAIGSKAAVALAEELTALVQAHRIGARLRPAPGATPDTAQVAVPVAAAAQPVDDDTDDEWDDGIDEDIDDDTDDIDEGPEMNALDEVGQQILEDMRRNAMPQGLTLLVTRQDGFPLSQRDADSALALVMPTLREVLPDVRTAAGVHNVDEPSQFSYEVTDADPTTLLRMGAGRDGFNAQVSLSGVGMVSVTSRVGQPADPELAAELGYVAELPEVPEGQHPINGVIAQIEQNPGDLEIGDFQVVYARPGGDERELTLEHVQLVLAHQVSRQGLSRFGDYEVVNIHAGQAPSEKVATFAFRGAAEIDPRTVALNCTQYRGSFDFGGDVGIVRAEARAEVLGHADYDDYEQQDGPY